MRVHKAEREEFIIAWIRQHGPVDAVNQAFHEAYHAAFPGYIRDIQPWGAETVPQAMRDLKRLADAGTLSEGRKTQERRIIEPQPEMEQDFEPEGYSWVPVLTGRELSHTQAPWQPGDVLYVRESWREVDDPEIGTCIEYSDAERLKPQWPSPQDGWRSEANSVAVDARKWRPRIYMPRWAARTFLRVESVRVERVQEISEADAVAEGCASITTFRDLWNSLYSARGLGWNANPWVWAYNLKLTAKPEGWPEV